MSYIIFGLFLGTVITVVLLILFGLLHRPTPGAIDLGSHKIGAQTQQCTRTQVSCPGTGAQGNSYCQESCQEGVEMVCSEMQKNNYVCTPANTNMKCNQNLGGALTWESSFGGDEMNWGCICMDPNLAAAQGVSFNQQTRNDLCQVNPNICGGPGNPGFTWNSSKTGAPSELCTCPSGKTKMINISSQTPICVPDGTTNWYTDTHIL